MKSSVSENNKVFTIFAMFVSLFTPPGNVFLCTFMCIQSFDSLADRSNCISNSHLCSKKVTIKQLSIHVHNFGNPKLFPNFIKLGNIPAFREENIPHFRLSAAAAGLYHVLGQ